MYTDNPDWLEPFLTQFNQPTVSEIIEQAIQKGLDSPRMGWVMSEILEMFSGSDRKKARDYILNRCNIKETS